jgi:FtsP/CotA-like multicopper oxidase with cupredoxin domain
VNDLGAWPDVRGTQNQLRDPTVTNLHTHGLHVSGMGPGDDVFAVIEPGDTGIYTYTIPCDHSGGTNWYHPHHHGSTAVQTNAGAAGMIVVESGAREASDLPAAYTIMPEQQLVMQEFNPPILTQYAEQSGDIVFETDIKEPFVLANGCEAAELTVEAGQWTRVHMLNVGEQWNSIVRVVSSKKGAVAADECDISLLGKDGVWLGALPRAVTGNAMFFSTSSRIDVAIRCPTAGEAHAIQYQHVQDPNAPDLPLVLGAITVVPSTRPAAADLPKHKPCRPAYLVDLTKVKAADMAATYPLEVRETFNGQSFIGPDEFILTMKLGEPQEWTVTGDDLHPMHVHVNHMQLSASLSAENQWAECPGWNVAGDWVDTLSAPGVTSVRVKPERFTGRYVLNCVYYIYIYHHTTVIIVSLLCASRSFSLQ